MYLEVNHYFRKGRKSPTTGNRRSGGLPNKRNALHCTHLKTVRTEHFIRIAQNFLQTAFPLLLGVNNDGLSDAVQALFRSDGVYVELQAKEEEARGQASFAKTYVYAAGRDATDNREDKDRSKSRRLLWSPFATRGVRST